MPKFKPCSNLKKTAWKCKIERKTKKYNCDPVIENYTRCLIVEYTHRWNEVGRTAGNTGATRS